MKLRTIIFAGTAALLLTNCGEKKKSDVIIVEKYEEPAPSGPIKMEAYSDSKSITWLGANYTYSIGRMPCDSLPKVTDEEGQKFVDNHVTLTISRADGSVFKQKTFTKEAFKSALTDNMYKKGILDGFVFHKAEGNSLYFAASVSYPQSDESIPLIISIDRMGDISVKRDSGE